jgi:hypothetical protein
MRDNIGTLGMHFAHFSQALYGQPIRDYVSPIIQKSIIMQYIRHILGLFHHPYGRWPDPFTPLFHMKNVFRHVRCKKGPKNVNL